MRSLLRFSYAVMAMFLLSIFTATSFAQTANDAATPKARRTGNLAITEFRADGPGGLTDEYVEICNISNAAFTILSDDPAATGLGVYSFEQSTNNIHFLFTIPNGVVFQPGQCFLGANTGGYTLSAYSAGQDAAFVVVNNVQPPGGGGTGAAIGSSTDGIPTDTGVLVLGSNAATFGSEGGLPAACVNAGCPSGGGAFTAIIDAVGFNVAPTITFPGSPAPNSPIFREGTGLNPINAPASNPTVNYAYVRRFCGVLANGPVGGTGGAQAETTAGTCSNADVLSGGVVQDTDVNNNDFFGSETAGGGTVFASGRPVAPNSTASANATGAAGSASNPQPGPVTFSSFGGVITPVVAIMGTPGPESFTGNDGGGVRTGSPRKRRFNSSVAALNFASGLFDVSAGNAFLTPNRERIFQVPRGAASGDPADNNEASSPLGTFSFRFTISNRTGQTITRLRYRIVDLTTDNRGVAAGAFSGRPAAEATAANQAILRVISSTTRRVFVSSGADLDCRPPGSGQTNATPGVQPCGGAGFKLSQGLILEAQPQGTVGAPGNTAAPTGTALGNGINQGLILENNAAFPATNGVGAGTGTLPSSRLPRGNGTLTLATPLANNDSLSVEFKFGVQQGGRFYIQIIPEADGGSAAP